MLKQPILLWHSAMGLCLQQLQAVAIVPGTCRSYERFRGSTESNLKFVSATTHSR